MAEQQQAQALVAQLQGMKEEGNQIAQKISELDQERHEHSLVIETLQKLDGSRKCYRMIGGVLTERTAGEVLPAVKENMTKLEEVCKSLYTRLQDKEKEMQEFQSKHNIRLQRPGEGQQKKRGRGERRRVSRLKGREPLCPEKEAEKK